MTARPARPLGDDRVLMARIFAYVRPHWRMFALGIVGMVMTAATEPAFPAILKHLLDRGFGEEGSAALIWQAPLAIIGLFMLRGIFTFTMNYAMNGVSHAVLYDLRREMFDRLVELPLRYFASHSSGTLIARVVADVQNVTQTLSSVLTVLVRDTVVIIGLLGWLLYLNWQLTTITLVLIPLIALAVGAFSKRMRRLSSEHIRHTGELTSVVRDKNGTIVEGDSKTVKRQRDVWVFARKMGSDDPNWQLVATGD